MKVSSSVPSREQAWKTARPDAVARTTTLARIDRLVALIDRALNTSVNAILHHAEFQAFEARWRGLAYLVGVAVGRGLTLPDAAGRVSALAAGWEADKQ